ncbi:MAG: hypothetical protein LBJ36_04010 [Synergistaceae bacterium]|nr:hypothetical protein [Synergistaceae bacterium]
MKTDPFSVLRPIHAELWRVEGYNRSDTPDDSPINSHHTALIFGYDVKYQWLSERA